MIKWKIICILVLFSIIGCISSSVYCYFNFRDYKISGTEEFDDYNNTVNFVREIEEIEHNNYDIVKNKHIELTGKGTKVEYSIKFNTYPEVVGDFKIYTYPKEWSEAFMCDSIGFFGAALLFFGYPMIRYIVSTREQWDNWWSS